MQNLPDENPPAENPSADQNLPANLSSRADGFDMRDHLPRPLYLAFMAVAIPACIICELGSWVLLGAVVFTLAYMFLPIAFVLAPVPTILVLIVVVFSICFLLVRFSHRVYRKIRDRVTRALEQVRKPDREVKPTPICEGKSEQ